MVPWEIVQGMTGYGWKSLNCSAGSGDNTYPSEERAEAAATKWYNDKLAREAAERKLARA